MTVFSVEKLFPFTSFITLLPSLSCFCSQDLSCNPLLPEGESWELIGILHGSRGKRPTDTSCFLKPHLVLPENCFTLRSVPSSFLSFHDSGTPQLAVSSWEGRHRAPYITGISGDPAFFHSTTQAHFSFLSSCSPRSHYKNCMEKHFLPPPL